MDHATFMKSPHPVGSLAWYIAQKFKAEGIAEGKAEGKAEVAIRLLRSGFDVASVSEYTELSVSEIEELQKQIS
jgi:predicted transposase/invertase (TIGR01784 family)